MAIKIYEQFAPFANPADGDYPYGSIKNDSIPGAEDGTPLDATWGNDMVGFTDALLAEAGIVPSGQPDKLGASQRVDAMKQLEKAASKVTKTGGGSVQDFIDTLEDRIIFSYRSIQDMLNDAPTKISNKDILSTGGSVWERISLSTNTLSDFKLLNELYFQDFGIAETTEDVSPYLAQCIENNLTPINLGGKEYTFLSHQDASSIVKFKICNGKLNYTPNSATLALTNYGQASGIFYSNHLGTVEFDDFEIIGNTDIANLGFVSGISIHKAKNAIFKNRVKASGFNFSGVIVGRSGKDSNAQNGYVDSLFVSDNCEFYGNRYSGFLCGDGGTATITNGNKFHHNGNDQDLLTGYGLAFYSNARFKEINITDNYAYQNARKGFDLHSGKKAIIKGNFSTGNKLFGIYHNSVIDGEISDTIADNHVDMRGYLGDTSNIPSDFEVFGLLVRQTFQAGGPTAGKTLETLIHDNHVIMPDYVAGVGRLIPISVRNNAQLKKVTANVHNNKVKGARCYGGIEFTNIPRLGYDLESFNAIAHHNYFEIGVLEAPLIWFNGASDFELVEASDNQATIAGTTFSQTAYIWLNSTSALGQFKTINNTIKSANPNKSVSIINIYTVSTSKSQMLSENNTINNFKEREWDGFRYIWWQNGITTPVTGSWPMGSVIQNYAPSIGSADYIVCIGGNDSGGIWAKPQPLVSV